MALSIINKAFSPDYELANSIIKTNHLDGNDPDITEKVSQIRVDYTVKDAVYELLAESIIKENHLNKNDPNITKELNQLKIDDNVKKGIYKILRIS